MQWCAYGCVDVRVLCMCVCCVTCACLLYVCCVACVLYVNMAADRRVGDDQLEATGSRGRGQRGGRRRGNRGLQRERCWVGPKDASWPMHSCANTAIKAGVGPAPGPTWCLLTCRTASRPPSPSAAAFSRVSATLSAATSTWGDAALASAPPWRSAGIEIRSLSRRRKLRLAVWSMPVLGDFT
jgi:hypothetical protein